jgi:NADH-quinone oxidoreductase subunit K
MLSIEHYLILSLVLFVIGVAGLMLRRNVLVMLMSIELMLNAVNINLVAFSRLQGSADGQVFSVFIVVVAAAEAVVAVAITLPFLRNRGTVNADDLDLLKW